MEPSLLRRRYSDVALAAIPRLLGMIDRNRFSPTYGCFDRPYWHYRTMDFPCGMSQEFGLPLALAHSTDFPDNPYRGQERLRELALAGVDFARRSAHADGTCDDYFPFERALGALVFSLNAMTETCLLLDDRRPEFLEFFARRARHLTRHNESGQLTNHQALAALALYNTYLVTGDAEFKRASDSFVGIVRDWFHPDEGWFQEYEGADPGYQSCTIAFLAKLYKKSGDPALLDLMKPGAEFCRRFMHPDGSYAGEYGSRNTFHFYPHGFEVLAGHGHGPSAEIADLFLTRGLPAGARYFNDDDRMCAHYVYDWMEAWRDFSPTRSRFSEEGAGDESAAFEVERFAKAGLVVGRSDRATVVIALNKGGVMKVIDRAGTVASDTGIIARDTAGTVLVSHLVDGEFQIEADDAARRYVVSGRLSKRRSKLATPITQVAFRLLNLTLGRFAPNLLRTVLQKILITGKPRTAWRFQREFTLAEGRVTVTTTLTRPDGAPALVEACFGSDATSIYVANSDVYQRGVLTPWRDAPALTADSGAETYTVEFPRQ